MKQLFTIGWCLICFCLRAQDSLLTETENRTENPAFTIRGYVKQLNGVSLDPSMRYGSSFAMLHNRLNIKWKPDEHFAAALEIRNRILWGDELRFVPDYASFLRNSSEWANLQKAWVNQPGMIIHSNVERLWLQWETERFTLRAGRQRINWGVTTNWNPNDLFNTFNFLDFDYEERPGADAISFNYSFKTDADLEMAIATTGHRGGEVAAMRYHLNRSDYDYYLLASWFRNQASVGAGWAGSIRDAGFKGELQWFPAMNDSAGQLNISTEVDYVFKKGWYINVGMLYTSAGTTAEISDLNLPLFRFSPKNLMPTKWNVSASMMKELTPLLTASCAVIYAPGTNLLIAVPSLSYSLMENLDTDVIWQCFWADEAGRLRSAGSRGFLRLKWSF